MKKIGREVHFLETSEMNSRIGEGSFVRLKSGTIMFGFTEFSTGKEDDDVAHISVIFSSDEGESWSDKKVLFEKTEKDKNIMSLSFLRMNNGDIGAFYIVKNTDGTDKIVLTRSADEGKTWSEPLNCIALLPKEDYYVLNNDRVIKLKNGRIVFALARHTIYGESDDFSAGELSFFYSDDDGATWEKSPVELKSPFSNDADGFQEPGLYEFSDGKIWCYIRTGLGFQFECFSENGGENWSIPQPNRFFSSPCSPMLVKKVKNLTVAVFNPVPEHILREDDEEFWGRTPYTIAVSEDNGKTFTREKLFYLEDDLENGYCYPAIIEGEDYILIAYYHSNNTACCLNSTKIIKIMYEELS